MSKHELMTKLTALPEPDFIHAGELSDPLGSNTSYRASTVVRLIEEAIAAERERCAKLASNVQSNREQHTLSGPPSHTRQGP